MARITTIALDADDTLWQNEQFYDLTKQRFAALLADYTDATELDRRLMAAVTANLGHYGFGMKGFALSMVETALEITDHRVPGQRHCPDPRCGARDVDPPSRGPPPGRTDPAAATA